VETRQCGDAARSASADKNERLQKTANMQGWLSVVIGGIKSAVAKFAKDNGIEFAWQTLFHDKIIRTQTAMNKIAYYIDDNIAKWDTDSLNEQ
jgi:hypothetical protein